MQNKALSVSPKEYARAFSTILGSILSNSADKTVEEFGRWLIVHQELFIEICLLLQRSHIGHFYSPITNPRKSN